MSSFFVVKFKISRAAPPLGTCLKTRHWLIEIEKRRIKPNSQWELNFGPFNPLSDVLSLEIPPQPLDGRLMQHGLQVLVTPRWHDTVTKWQLVYLKWLLVTNQLGVFIFLSIHFPSNQLSNPSFPHFWAILDRRSNYQWNSGRFSLVDEQSNFVDLTICPETDAFKDVFRD